jgi:glyoxylase-like metal-dependent hydrolase (beta-lactamase superfamily II)
MEICRFTINPFQINCYIYWDQKTKEGLLIDPGAYTQKEENEILEFIEKKDIEIKYIINTHGHIDHILGNSFAKRNYDVPLMINKEDKFLVDNAEIQSKLFGLEIKDYPPFDNYIEESKSIKIGDSDISFLHTPGHSPGSMCIIDIANKNVITGDVLFRGSIGRTDLQGGDYQTLITNIKNKLLKVCKDDFRVYPGHNESTTIGYEKKYNPFLN